jgi:alkylhydroperoxidase family enzyme
MTMPLPMTSAALALGASPDIESAFHAVWEALGRQHHLPAAILELARLRLAAMHRADREMALRSPWASGLSEPKAALVLTGSWHRAADFAASEKAVLAFAEIYAQGAEFITDELAADIQSHFGDAGLVCLIEALGFIDARIRLALLFNRLRPAP